MTKDLNEKTCKPCESGAAPLSSDHIKQLLSQIPGWQLNKNMIERKFQFKNFYQTMAFVNAIAWIANQENHHPDLSVGFNYCLIRYQTHAMQGLSENDFICAAKINKLIER